MLRSQALDAMLCADKTMGNSTAGISLYKVRREKGGTVSRNGWARASPLSLPSSIEGQLPPERLLLVLLDPRLASILHDLLFCL